MFIAALGHGGTEALLLSPTVASEGEDNAKRVSQQWERVSYVSYAQEHLAVRFVRSSDG